MNCLFTFYHLRSLLSLVFLAIGIILLIVRKFKKNKTKALFVIGSLFSIFSILVILMGCYNTYIKPKYKKANFSEQALVEFCDNAISSKKLSNPEMFLPNNSKLFYELDNNIIEQGVAYGPNCMLQYWLWTYKDSDTSQKEFENQIKKYEGFEKKFLYFTKENYSVFVPPIENDASFFNWHTGDYNSQCVKIYIKYGSCVVVLSEQTEKFVPLLYKLVNENLLFNDQYKLKSIK